jgi:hypothetical protein
MIYLPNVIIAGKIMVEGYRKINMTQKENKDVKGEEGKTYFTSDIH